MISDKQIYNIFNSEDPVSVVGLLIRLRLGDRALLKQP